MQTDAIRSGDRVVVRDGPHAGKVGLVQKISAQSAVPHVALVSFDGGDRGHVAIDLLERKAGAAA